MSKLQVPDRRATSPKDRTRLFAVLGGINFPVRTKHYLGLPPELSEGEDKRELLPVPRFLFIEASVDSVFLYRYAADGSFSGDTWHANVDDAKHQAEYEYGEAVGNWREVPRHVEDAVEFALRGLPGEPP